MVSLWRRSSAISFVEAVEGERVGRQPVVAGAADLLVVALDVRGHVGVTDEAHVGLVDAHAEGDGRDHHDAVLLQEGVLVAAARALVHAGVIGERAHAAPAEVLGEGLGAQARGAIDDAAFALVAGDELGELAARLVLRLEAERDVRPVE